MNLSRRGLLIGLAAGIAAPPIVRAEALMPIKVFDPYYTRAIATYEIMTDTVLLRIDRARRPLRMDLPSTAGRIVPLREAYRFIPKRTIDRMLAPGPGEQMNLTCPLDCAHLLRMAS